jgi:thiamine biosynthesis lipoprotein
MATRGRRKSMTESSNLQRRLRIGLGTFIAIEASALPGEDAAAAIDAAFGAMEQVQRLMHPTEAHSDVAALNTGEPKVAVRVHAWTWEVLRLAQRLNRRSRGLFDPCLPCAAGRLEDLELPEPQVAIPQARLNIDLGGIAKGYAVDRAVIALRAAGCVGGLVNAGGDVRAFGPRSHDIVCRGRGSGLAGVPLHNAALAMSDAGGGAERPAEHRRNDDDGADRPAEHQGYYNRSCHGDRITGTVAVTAATAAVADALTKCLLAGRPGACAALFAAFGARQIALRPE